MKNTRIFEYKMDDAWHVPLSDVTIYSDGAVTYYKPPKKYLSSPRQKTVTISKNALQRIKEILADDRIYAIKRLDSNRDFVVCDGYKYEFFFSSGDKKARRKKNNIFNCKVRQIDICKIYF